MDYGAVITEVTGTNPKGIIASVFIPYLDENNTPDLSDSASDAEKKEAQEIIKTHNEAIERIHVGNCLLRQIIDSAEVDKDEEKTKQ